MPALRARVPRARAAARSTCAAESRRWRTQRVLLAGHALPFERAAVVGGLQLTARLAGRVKDFDRFVHVVGHQPAAHRRTLACGFARVVAGVEQAEHQARGLLHPRRHRQKIGAGAAHQVFSPHRGGQRRGAEVVKLAKAVDHAGTGHAQVARAQRPQRSGAVHVEPREVGPDAGQAGLFRRAGFVALGAGRGEPGHFPGQFDRRPGTAPVVLRHRVRARATGTLVGSNSWASSNSALHSAGIWPLCRSSVPRSLPSTSTSGACWAPPGRSSHGIAPRRSTV